MTSDSLLGLELKRVWHRSMILSYLTQREKCHFGCVGYLNNAHATERIATPSYENETLDLPLTTARIQTTPVSVS